MKSPHQNSKRINVQAKSGLARLMAIENLHVRHSSKVTTANIDLINRVVTLPVLNNMHGYMYDWFIAHEISHALYTPVKAIDDVQKNHPDLPFHYINTTEDARIEKKIKRKYPGTIHDSNKFYKDTASPERDFFGYHKKIAMGEDPANLPFIDRVNLHFKIGHLYNIPLNNDDEKRLVKQTGDAETFEESLQAALDIHNYVKQNKMKISSSMSKPDPNDGKEDDSEEDQQQQSTGQDDEDNTDSNDNEQSQSGSSNEDDGDDEEKSKASKDDDSDEQTDSEPEHGDTDPDDSTNDDGGSDSEPEPELDENGDPITPNYDEDGAGFTQDEFDNNFINNEVNQDAIEDGYSFGDVARLKNHDERIESYNELFEKLKFKVSLKDEYQNALLSYSNFLSKITPTVNMMVTQFNMRKSAQEYQKLRETSSGTLNMKKIAQYKTSKDLFVNNEIVTQAQNHGMVMLLDWSGSMSSFINKTVKQLLVLMEFCNKVNIPFDVYAFVSASGHNEVILPNEIFSPQDSKLVHIFSSSEHKTKFRDHCARINYLVETGKHRSIAEMGSTPMYHAIFLMEYCIKKFQEKHKVEKTVFCVLTDGYPDGGMFEGHHFANRAITMRNRFTGKNYTFNQYEDEVFHHLLQYVKDECNISSLIGFYVTNSYSSDLAETLCPNVYVDNVKCRSLFDKNNYVEFPKSLAFDKYYIVSVNNFDFKQGDYMKSVDGNTSKNAMLQAMKNHSTQGLNNMIFMKKFIEEIS